MSAAALIVVSPFSVVQTFPDGRWPEPIVWPNGDASHAAQPGFRYGKWMLAPANYTPASPGEFYAPGTAVPSFDGKTVTFVQGWVAAPLAVVQAALLRRIDNAAEASRAKYLNVNPGQLYTYQQKLDEVTRLQAWQVATSAPPVVMAYPMLNATVGIEAKSGDGTLCTSVLDVMGNVQAAAAQWAVVAGAIEAARIGGKIAISAATTVDAAAAAFAAIAWK